MFFAMKTRKLFKDQRIKICFLSTGITGTFSYLYCMMNNLNNYDNIAVTPSGYGTGIASGRWLLTVLGDTVDKIWGNYNIPFFNGVLALLLIGLSSLLLVWIFEINNKVMCFLLSAVTVAFPTVAGTMFFTYTVHYYMLSLLFGVSGIYILQIMHNLQKLYQKAGCLLAAAFLFACSLGIYQAYLPFVAGVLVLRLIQFCLDDEVNWKSIPVQAVLYFCSLVMGYLFYRLALKVSLFLYHTNLGTYKGIDSMGQIDLHQLPGLLHRAFFSYVMLFREEYCSVNPTLILRICITLIDLFVIISLVFIWEKTICKTIEICILLGILPLASNAIIIMVPSGSVYTLMVMGMITVFYLPVVVHTKLDYQQKHLAEWFNHGVVIFVITISILNYVWLSNGNYRALYYANRKTENYFVTMWSRITATAGYHEDMPVVFIGSNIDDTGFHENWSGTPFYYGGNIGAVAQINEYSRGQFLSNYLGRSYLVATEDHYNQYHDEIEQMDTYPNDSSIKIVDGNVFVKLEDISLEK